MVFPTNDCKVLEEFRRKTVLLIIMNFILLLNKSRKNCIVHLYPQYENKSSNASNLLIGYHEIYFLLSVVFNTLPIMTLIWPHKRTRFLLLGNILWNTICITNLFENSINLLISIYDLKIQWQIFTSILLNNLFLTILNTTLTLEVILFFDYLKYKQ